MPAATCRRFTNDAQPGRGVGDIGGAQCVAIHLRTIERRQIAISDDVFGEKAAERVEQSNSFERECRGVFSD